MASQHVASDLSTRHVPKALIALKVYQECLFGRNDVSLRHPCHEIKVMTGGGERRAKITYNRPISVEPLFTLEPYPLHRD